MSESAAGLLARHYRRTNDRILAVVDDLTDEQLTHAEGERAHSVAFNLWHLARWADHLQSRIPLMTPALGEQLGERRQVWDAEELAARWGFAPDALGYHETGMGMADADAAGLPLPPRAELLAYARRAFAAAEEAIGAVDDEQLHAPNRTERVEGGNAHATVGDALLAHVTHNNRHLGEIECARGLQGLRGTATR